MPSQAKYLFRSQVFQISGLRPLAGRLPRLDFRGRRAFLPPVTLQQIQRQVRSLPKKERLALAAYLRHLSRAESLTNQRSLDAAAARMARGEKVTRPQLRRLHKSLEAAGA